MASPNGVPVMKELSLSWFPPVMNTASTSASGADQLGVVSLGAALAAAADDLCGAQRG